MNICLRYTAHETDALTVLNTGFLKIYRSINRYDPATATLYTWMRTIVVNSCLDHIKSKQKQIPLTELEAGVEIQLEADVINRLKAEEILELVRQLPPATQAVFNLYVMEDYSHREIAGALGISEGTSKWHLSEARRQLKQAIEKQE